MSATNLLNLTMALVVSDPWEFGTECGTGPFIGTVTDATSESLLIQLLKPINFSGKSLRTVVVYPRHQEDTIRMTTVKAMPANFTLLPLDIQLISELSTSMTRSGIAAIGTIESKGVRP
jgi:hypothetical protein